ncbi:MAG: hypothetical protein KZQ87_07495 [Candidatus Thiodiazotropha sp. (ex Cardiolucina cf. quadrata)]|nr:hypothetical protein [Candidatus Thiodiazotropha sp. (ex Cardiolucina cf. quadrata)]
MIELIYGSKEIDLKKISHEIGKVLGLEFKGHESVYKGIYYKATLGENEYQVMDNELADYDDQPEENKEYSFQIETHKHCPSLIWIDLLSNNAKVLAKEIKSRISNSKINIEFISENEY